MANTKSETKNPATKVRSRAQLPLKDSTKRKSAETKSSKTKSPSSRKDSKKSDDKSGKGTDLDVAESTKIEPPPPDVAEPDKAKSPEEAEQARKS